MQQNIKIVTVRVQKYYKLLFVGNIGCGLVYGTMVRTHIAAEVGIL